MLGFYKNKNFSHEKYGDVFKYQFLGQVSVFTSNKEAIKVNI